MCELSRLFLLLFVLIAFPSVIAVSDVALTWAGYDIEAVGTHPFVANLRFRVPSDVSEVLVNVSELSDQVTEPKRVLSSACGLLPEGLLECFVPNLVVVISDFSPSINFTTLSGAVSSSETVTLSLTSDTTSPVVTELATRQCADDECFIGSLIPTDVFITLQDSVGSFNRKRVFYTADGALSLVYFCDGSVCKGSTLVSCGQGSSVRLSIASYGGLPSSDDAGNPLTGLLENAVVCDAAPPLIGQGVDVLTGGIAGTSVDLVRPFIIIGESSTLVVNVTESSPDLKVSVDLSELSDEGVVNGSCARAGELWSCSVTVEVHLDTPVQDVILPIMVTDIVGHVARKEVRIDVLEPLDPGIVPDDWEVSVVSPSSTSVNRNLIAFTPRTLYTSVTLQQLGSSSYTIVDVDESVSCKPFVEDGVTLGTQNDVVEAHLDFVGKSDGQTLMLLKTIMRSGTHYDSFSSVKYNCSVGVLTRKGKLVSRQYERVEIPVTVTFHATRTLGQKLQDEIQEALKADENAKALNDAKKALAALKTVCNLFNIGKNTAGVMSAAAVPLDAFELTKPASDALDDGAESVNQGLGDQNEMIVKACTIASCSSDWNTKGPQWLAENIGFLDDASQFAGYNNFAESLSPYDSIITASLMLCPDAFIYHIERYYSTSCEYARCLAHDVPLGVPIEVCQDTRQYAQCTYTMGQVFNGIPLLSSFKKALSTVINIAKDPVSLISTGTVFAACKLGAPNSLPEKICHSEKSFRAIIEAKETFNRFRQTYGDLLGRASTNGQSSPCDQMRASINAQTLYWEWDETEKNLFSYQPEGLGDDVYCNAFTGCSKRLEVDGDTTTYLTFVPSGNSVSVYVNAKKVADGATTVTTTHVDPIIENILSAHGMASSAPEVGGLVETTLDYKEMLYQSLPPEMQHLSVLHENYLRAHIDYLDVAPGLQQSIGQYQNDIGTLDNVDDAYRRIAQARTTLNTIGFSPVAACADCTAEGIVQYAQSNGLSASQLYPDNAQARANFRIAAEAADMYNKNADIISQAQELLGSYDEDDSIIVLINPELITEDNVDEFIAESKTEINKVKKAIEQELEVAEEHLKEIKKVEEEALDKIEVAQYMQENWGSKLATWRSTLRFGRAVNSVSPKITQFLHLGAAQEWWQERMSWLFDNGITNTLLNPEKEFCEAYHNTGSSSYALSQTSSTTFVSSAFVEGFITRQGYGNDLNYSYVVNVFVENHDRDDLLKFRVLLTGSEGSKTIVSEQSLAKGQKFSRTLSNYLFVQGLDEQYSSVCIEFLVSDINDWFDVDLDDNKLCGRLRLS